MFKFYRYKTITGKDRDIPKGYYIVKGEPTYNFGSHGWTFISSKEHFTFDEVITCLRKCIFEADYVGCYSYIYWEYYKEFYEWIKQSFENNNTSDIKIIKKFYKKTLVRWIKFVEYSDDTFYPQNEYFRMMGKEIEKHLM